MKIFKEDISERVWDIKYRYRYQGKIIDNTIEDTWQRTAKAIAKIEPLKIRNHWQKKFYDALENFNFLPGGRILAGAGTKHAVTLFNCFVMPVADSLTHIFDSLKESAITLQQGGGIGCNFSSLRPRGFLTSHTGGMASGPVSFMRIWNSMCATMLSTGSRRGAMMGILRCDHPDIEEFIRAKADPKELRHFNVSVWVTDKFMQAVKKNQSWKLAFPESESVKQVSARELWELIIKSAYDYAEPGVIFGDTVNKQNNLWYCEDISATNPCGEIPLPAYGACNLGSINLAQLVINPFKENAALDWKKISELTSIATRFLDNVIDVSRYPLKQQKIQSHFTRRIGVGITGLADMLVMLGLRYGSDESLKLVKKIMRQICEVTWQTSIELSKERGKFPAFKKEKYLQGHFVKKLPPEIKKAIEKYGVRNSHHNTIAPTGTISLLANNVSNGIEPIFSAHYQRTIRTPSGSLQKFDVTDRAIRIFQEEQNEKKLPPEWVDSQALMPEDHLKIQAAVQPYIDNSISKTIHVPVDFPFEKLMDVYTKAYELGLKGCTIYRPNEVTGSVLSLTNSMDDADRCCL